VCSNACYWHRCGCIFTVQHIEECVTCRIRNTPLCGFAQVSTNVYNEKTSIVIRLWCIIRVLLGKDWKPDKACAKRPSNPCLGFPRASGVSHHLMFRQSVALRCHEYCGDRLPCQAQNGGRRLLQNTQLCRRRITLLKVSITCGFPCRLDRKAVVQYVTDSKNQA